ncbi:uncharacterized protein LOC135209221 [Macrobrachium nipponense]|uniref:uncharacterized protein LOC135209221 n=1 Tax=Macrobrachium nipponense TaxID=159736 RepID=UPI0030C8768F
MFPVFCCGSIDLMIKNIDNLADTRVQTSAVSNPFECSSAIHIQSSSFLLNSKVDIFADDDINTNFESQVGSKLQKLEELQAIEREEEALRQRREKLRLEAEIAEVVAEEKVLQQFDENNREIAPVTRIREHIDPDIDRSEQPMGLGAVAPEVSSGGNNQGDLSNKEILQTLISCSLKGLMPKQDMAKFDGDYTKYFRFIRSFDDIFSSQLTNDKERLRYLDLYTTGRPNEIVAVCLHLDASEGYRQARKLLEERYGNLEQIATAYVDKVIKWKDMGENNAEDFDEYAVMLKTCRNAISCVPYGVAELQNPKTMRLILSKFPSSVRD